ncbi:MULTISPECIES: glucose-1-phosphate thymidylyltransferase RfbA [Micromonospora]|uniref:glucose-1-phosphate thymidylyltransferase RfbA n=1 Tax=Micromonospora TaxID=1873 RepID=UPI00098D0329|nr:MULTISPECIES: glucose-1-phosphate thymidylyltransferase RfbA [unclassified Micromonospora]OON28351.1 glucose-1-phosphate thymidylyltransferase [Micromonospora sp. Rc5]
MKGIVLAGGSGTRLHPLTVAFSKQLLPLYDKPMIYYPLSTLMLGGVREFLIISTPADLPLFRKLLGTGAELGLRISYAEQQRPAGIAEAFRIGADFVGPDPVSLILGDNIFHSPQLPGLLARGMAEVDGCALFGHTVADPRPYGVVEKDAEGRLVGIEEKPARPRSSEIVTGLYVYSADVVELAHQIRPSARGELEITDVNRHYLAQGRARLHSLGPDSTWLDAGTYDGLLDAAAFVRSEQRRGIRIACPEEIAFRMGYIDADALYRLGSRRQNSGYGRYLMDISRGAVEAGVGA